MTRLRTLTIVLLASCLAPLAYGQGEDLPQPAATAEATDSDQRFEQQVGYSIGLDLGRRLKSDGIPIDLRAIVSGLRDGLTGADPKLTDEQITAVMTQLQQQMQQKAKARLAEVGSKYAAEGEAFLKENGAKEGVQTTESGLQYRIIEEGNGASPKLTDRVRCHYEGKFINGEVFDSSIARGEPATFPVGGVIKGWTEALQLMKVGGKWQVFVPGDIAYGPEGRPGIPPNATLIFTIELLGIE